MSADIPFGYCHCGCGSKTKISKWTDKRCGSIKGEPRRYLNGHSTRVPFMVRFFGYILKTNSCWEWTGDKDTGGYGVIWDRDKKSLLKAHRVSWAIYCGDIPNKMNVLHKCDNPKCINPAHLFLGTQADNVADMMSKKRHKTVPQYGEMNPMARLTSSQVMEIRKEKASGAKQSVIAAKYGVSPMTISRIVNNQLWRQT